MAKDKKYHIHLRGNVGDWRFDAEYVEYVLSKYPDEQVDVLINSLGGSASTALTISAAFRRHGNVHVHYEAMNASAATIASLGSKRVTIDKDAFYLVHKCSQVVFVWEQLNADQMQDLIDQYEKVKKNLDKIDLQIAKSYADRCKKDSKDLLELMKEGAWLTAAEALEWGFVDEVTDNPEDDKPHLTAEVRDFMASEGIPVPDLPMEDEKDEAGLFARLREYLRNHYNHITEPITNQQNETTMKKTFMLIAAVLALQAFECEEGGKRELTCEQLGDIEDRLKQLNDQAEADKAAITQRDEQINDLKAQLAAKETELSAKAEQLKKMGKQPAAQSAQVTENKKEGNTETSRLQEYCNEMKEANELLNQFKK